MTTSILHRPGSLPLFLLSAAAWIASSYSWAILFSFFPEGGNLGLSLLCYHFSDISVSCLGCKANGCDYSLRGEFPLNNAPRALRCNQQPCSIFVHVFHVFCDRVKKFFSCRCSDFRKCIPHHP